MTIYDLVLQWQGKEDCFFFLLQMNVGLLIGLFYISGFPTFQSGVLRLFSLVAQLIYLFIVSCMLHVTVTCTMLQKQILVFSIFIITVYQSLKSNLCSFHMKTFLPSPVCLTNTVLVCLITSPVSDASVISK